MEFVATDPAFCFASLLHPTGRRVFLRTVMAPPKQRGFTLIEMLVVIMLMGVLIGLVSISVSPDEKGRLRVEAERLAQLLSLASEESRLTGKPIRWLASDNGYRFLRVRKDGEWGEIRDNDTLRARTLPSGTQITGLSVNARPRSVRQLEFVPYETPQLFSINMTLGDVRAFVTSTPIGEIRVTVGSEEANAAVVR